MFSTVKIRNKLLLASALWLLPAVTFIGLLIAYESLVGALPVLWSLLAVVALVVVQLLLHAWLVQRYIVNRIRTLRDGVQAFSRGDFSVRLVQKGHDELSDLERGFNDMCAEMADSHNYLQRLVDMRTRQATETTQRLQAILGSVSDAIISVNEEGRVLAFNSAAERIFGYKESEILGKSIEILMVPTGSSLRSVFVAASEAGMSANSKTRVRGDHINARRKNGDYFPVAISARRGETNGEVFYTGVIEDLTEKQATARKLAEKEALLNTAIHSSAQPFAIMGTFGDFLEVNDALCEWLGYSREVLLEKNMLDVTAETDRQRSSDTIEALRSGRLRTVNREKQFLRRDGQKIWGMLSTTAVQEESGDVLLFVSQVMDINETKSLTLELERRNKELERSNADLDKFAYVASHDLKSPLNAIRKIVSWIEEDEGSGLSQSTLENLSLLRGRTDRMLQLLNDLLLYSRVNRMESQLQWVDLHEMCESVFYLMDKPGSFSLEVSHARVCVPRVPFELVMRNLISNAIKHHDKPDGHIQIRHEERDGRHVFRVEDNGPGIPPDMQLKALEMFQTLKPRDKVEGSGIGLALVKRTVEFFGGKVQIESDGENGTAVVFEWPLAACDSVEESNACIDSR